MEVYEPRDTKTCCTNEEEMFVSFINKCTFKVTTFSHRTRLWNSFPTEIVHGNNFGIMIYVPLIQFLQLYFKSSFFFLQFLHTCYKLRELFCHCDLADSINPQMFNIVLLYTCLIHSFHMLVAYCVFTKIVFANILTGNNCSCPPIYIDTL